MSLKHGPRHEELHPNLFFDFFSGRSQEHFGNGMAGCLYNYTCICQLPSFLEMVMTDVWNCQSKYLRLISMKGQFASHNHKYHYHVHSIRFNINS